VFFRNSECLACHTPLGYDTGQLQLLPLEPDPAPGWWRAADGTRPAAGAVRWRRCAQLDTAAACNWLVAEDDAHAGDPAQCRACRLTRQRPDLSDPANVALWGRIELAKRRLVSLLLGLRLPVQARQGEDPQRGLAFDLLRAAPGGPAIITGHADGVITLDVEEADDATREQRRTALREPYRTLLGHLRHETGHYYWQLLVQGEGSAWLEPFRAVFGDERQDYAAALRRHHEQGPPADWAGRHVSAYASSHPWEDWAETWAHYLHLVDTVDTARSFNLDGSHVGLEYEPFDATLLEGPEAAGFLVLLQGWMELTGVLNELSRSMGVPDFYPFVLSAPAVRKLYLVHRVAGMQPAAAPR
jgi:hypothetical protein